MSVNGVQAVSFSSNTPVEDDNDMWTTFKFDHAIKEADFQAITKFADKSMCRLINYNWWPEEICNPPIMTREFLVNESLVKSLGFKKPEDILNKEISMLDDQIKCPVVGVLKDFNDRSFRNDLAPLLITTNITMYRQAAIKLATTNISSTMQSVKKIWEQTFPDYVYEYKFLDDKIESFYKQETQLAQLYKIFAAIAIFLSCLGLYGLASFMAAQRIKEVGIRKVLGATAANIVYLFSKEFILLIAIAFVDCYSNCMVFYAPMVARLCLSNQHQLVVICCRRTRCHNNCAGNNQLPGNKSGDSKSGEVIANRVRIMLERNGHIPSSINSTLNL